MNYIIGEIQLRPIFIIKGLKELEKLKFLLQLKLNSEVVIKELGNYKALYIRNEMYEEALDIGLSIAESENIKGIWLDVYRIPRSLDCFPLKKYIIKDYLNNIIISATNEEEYSQIIKEEENKKNRIKKYFKNLQKHLSCSLMIRYDLEGNLDISVYCKYSKFKEIKNKLLEFELSNELEELLISNDSNYNLKLIKLLKET